MQLVFLLNGAAKTYGCLPSEFLAKATFLDFQVYLAMCMYNNEQAKIAKGEAPTYSEASAQDNLAAWKQAMGQS